MHASARTSTALTRRPAALLISLVVLMAGFVLVGPAHRADAAVAAMPGTKVFASRVITEAKRHNGQPYVWGAAGPSRFDCSGFTLYVMRKAVGKKLPRTSRQQYAATRHIAKSQLRPGDLVFYKNSRGGVYHVGIYAGAGKIWHASNPRTDVKLGKIYSKNWAAGRLR